jgi:two-component system, OmpR family, sensor histidine kinase KdpD
MLDVIRFTQTDRRRLTQSALAADAPFNSETEQLSTFIRNTTELDTHAKPGPQLAVLVQSIFHLDSVAIFDSDLNEVYRAGEWFDRLRDLLQNICIFGTISEDPETGLTRRVLRMGKLSIGALLLRGEISPTMSNAIASVIAITFDRYHAFANETRTESARRTEQLRTTVLDSLAHAYKTPLTVISAASGGLGTMGGLSPSQSGLVGLIDEQTALLNQLTTRLLKTARLEASDLVPRAETIFIEPLIENIVASLRDQLACVSVKIEVSCEDLSIRCDRGLLTALLTQYIDNAAKYGNAGTTVTIKAAERDVEIIFSVHSFGPVIPPTDFERIFDRYYRCSVSTNMAPGTGIGLSIAKRTTQAQGGHVWVTSHSEKGTTFYASLPTVPKGGIPS